MKYENNDDSVKFIAESMVDAFRLGRVFSRGSDVNFNLFLDHVDNGVYVNIEIDQLFKMLSKGKTNG